MTDTKINGVYERLLAAFGPQSWWPAQTPFEMVIGAILTQSVAWGNVEKAIKAIKEMDLLAPAALRNISPAELSRVIHPSGYHNIKARRLKAFVEHLGTTYDDDLNRFLSQGVSSLREELLKIYGIGEETADSIILYAGSKPVFVIDAYTRRIICRVGLAPTGNGYKDYQALFTDNLPINVELFNEYHALLVKLAKENCRTKPLCESCCLNTICPTGLNNISGSWKRAG